MNNELLYQIALTLIPHIGAVQAKGLIEHFGEASAVFKATKRELSGLENIGEVRAGSIKRFFDFTLAEKEISFIEKYQIQPLFLTDEKYPKRLLHCYDSPVMLYFKGDADLNASRVISIVGTRHNTDYAKQMVDKLLQSLQPYRVLVMSGLAFGVDALAHKTALQYDLSTVGVLAHGLQTIYPSQHKSMAKEMLQNGGLLTEFMQNTIPDKHNFPRRNRIVAGMADATVVVETALKGGSMITAELANGYNRDIFAFPGKASDPKSAGCNLLIRQNKAALLTDGVQLIEMMGWEDTKKKKAVTQTQLFIELSGDEQAIMDVMSQQETTAIDELHAKCGLSSSAIAMALLNLEMQGVLVSLPGKCYKKI